MIVQPLVTRQQMHGRGHLNRDKRDGTAARAQTAEPCSNHIPILSALASTIELSSTPQLL